MFEVPEAKRVRREDLNASDESDRSDSGIYAELEARLSAQIAKSFDLDEGSSRPLRSKVAVATTAPKRPPRVKQSADSDSESEPKTPVDQDATGGDGEEIIDDGFEFRLFSTAGPAPKVVLEDDTKVQEGGLVRGRPLSYYVATDISREQKQQYESAALSGDDVLAHSQWRAWGLELPWRVTNIEVTRKAKKGGGADMLQKNNGGNEEYVKRKRPGKKSRLAARIKGRELLKKDEEMKKKMEDKEELLKEKKKRMNRLKKLRKRAKNKERKKTGDDDGGGDDESEGGSSVEE